VPDFEGVAPRVDESLHPGEDAASATARLSRSKALSVAERRADALIFAADTLVEIDGRALGKPSDACEGALMLRALRGRAHTVFTAVCLLDTARRPLEGLMATDVYIRPFSEAELRTYLSRGDFLDKAGAYAIQDATFRPVASFSGCYDNVVGLPTCLARRLLQQAGVELRPTRSRCRHHYRLSDLTP
jgi:septum formation protein